jgi:hypothetical protein
MRELPPAVREGIAETAAVEAVEAVGFNRSGVQVRRFENVTADVGRYGPLLDAVVRRIVGAATGETVADFVAQRPSLPVCRCDR